ARRSEIESVTLLDPAPIYEMLNRIPASKCTQVSMIPLRQDAKPWEAEVLQDIESAWAKNKRWHSIQRSDALCLRPIQLLARALMDGRLEGQDKRSFSAKVAGDSKLLETKPRLVAAYLYPGQ